VHFFNQQPGLIAMAAKFPPSTDTTHVVKIATLLRRGLEIKAITADFWRRQLFFRAHGTI
jgi:hypothetical protein